MEQLKVLRGVEKHHPSAPKRHGELAYEMLNMKPGAVSLRGVTQRYGKRGRYIPFVFEAFIDSGLLSVVRTIQTSSKTHRDITLYNAEPALGQFAGDYNHLFAENLHERVDPSSLMPDFAYRTLRGYALLNNVSLDPAAPYRQSLGELSEGLAKHPQSIIYRSMAACAFATGVQNELDNAIAMQVRECEAG